MISQFANQYVVFVVFFNNEYSIYGFSSYHRSQEYYPGWCQCVRFQTTVVLNVSLPLSQSNGTCLGGSNRNDYPYSILHEVLFKDIRRPAVFLSSRYHFRHIWSFDINFTRGLAIPETWRGGLLERFPHVISIHVHQKKHIGFCWKS